MFEVPGSGISGVHVTEEYVKGETTPQYERRDIVNPEVNEEDDVNTSIRIKQWSTFLIY